MWFFKVSRQKEKTDVELLEVYQQSGDTVFLSELFDRYVELVFGTCMKYLKNEEESKDAVMQVYELLTEKVKQHEIANFKSWLYVLVKNHCLMHLRREKKSQLVGIEDLNSDNFMESEDVLHQYIEGNEEGITEKEKLLQLLESGIEQLDEKQKTCLQLFYLEEKCYNEIVEITGFELKKVKSYLQNGKRKLKIYIEKASE